MNTKKPLVLIDGTAYLHRAFHALPPLTNSKGKPTGAIYGVINMLRKLISDYNPEYIAVIFDAKGKNFRHELYHEYKANRPPMQEELRQQLKPLYAIIEAMGLALISISGVEADDVIATIATNAQEANLNVLVSTSDKDLAQLVNDNVTLINTMTGKVLDIKGVKQKFGVTPSQIVDYLTLVGDTSDNVPGVTGIGPKTAVKLLTQYESLENLIKHAHEIKGKVGENLRNSLDKLPLIKKLVTTKHDVELKQKIQDLKRSTSDNPKLAKLFKELEFKTWLETLQKDLANSNKNSNTSLKYKIVLNTKDLNSILDELRVNKEFAFSIETTSHDIIDAKITGITIAISTAKATYIPLAPEHTKQLSYKVTLKKLQPFLENPDTIKISRNLKYTIAILENHNIKLSGPIFDITLEAYLLDAGSNQYDLETLSIKYLDKNIEKITPTDDKEIDPFALQNVKPETAAQFSVTNAVLFLQLHNRLWQELKEQQSLVNVYKNIDQPLLTVLAIMEHNGVLIDTTLLEKQSDTMEKQLEKLENAIYREADAVFNINSPLQLQEILFSKLNLPILQKTPKGQPSTAEATLQELALHYAIPKLILEFRSLSKLKSTYIDALPAQVNPKTGRIHTSYNQTVTSTGRLSSTNPNLQNIPIRTEAGRKIRQAFIAAPSYKLISADYSQIELRIMAHLSGDKTLQRAFHEGADIHQATAAEIFGIPQNQVSPEQRQRAKAINFGLIYGMSAFGLAKRLGLERNIAQGYIDTYFSRYPQVKIYMEEICKKAQQFGFVETMSGRRIPVPHIKSKNFHLRTAAERAAINAPIQGTAADIIKLAMIDIASWLEQQYTTTPKSKAKMLIQVHDELVFEVPETGLQIISTTIKTKMETVAKLTVPLVVEIGIGNNWDEAH